MSHKRLQVLVLHDVSDPSLSLLRTIAANSCDLEFHFLSGDELFLADCRRIEIDNGRIECSIELHGGDRFICSDFHFVVNQLRTTAFSLAAMIATEDISYVLSEHTAFIIAMLGSFSCPVLNFRTSRPSYYGFREDIEWQVLAARSGFRIPDDTQRDFMLGSGQARQVRSVFALRSGGIRLL